MAPVLPQTRMLRLPPAYWGQERTPSISPRHLKRLLPPPYSPASTEAQGAPVPTPAPSRTLTSEEMERRRGWDLAAPVAARQLCSPEEPACFAFRTQLTGDGFPQQLLQTHPMDTFPTAFLVLPLQAEETYPRLLGQGTPHLPPNITTVINMAVVGTDSSDLSFHLGRAGVELDCRVGPCGRRVGDDGWVGSAGSLLSPGVPAASPGSSAVSPSHWMRED